jgi:hypothetical protein
MLAPYELFFSLFVAIVLFPVIVAHLIAGSPPSSSGPLRKYQLAEPRLDLVSNVFVLTLCLMVINRLAQHFGLLGAGAANRIDGMLEVPFLFLFFVFLAFLLKALFRVHRSSS